MFTLEVAQARIDDLRREADLARRDTAPRTSRRRWTKHLFR